MRHFSLNNSCLSTSLAKGLDPALSSMVRLDELQRSLFPPQPFWDTI